MREHGQDVGRAWAGHGQDVGRAWAGRSQTKTIQGTVNREKLSEIYNKLCFLSLKHKILDWNLTSLKHQHRNCPNVVVESSCPGHVCVSAINRPVYEVKKDVGSWKDHTWVLVDNMCVLDYAEVAQPLLLGSRGGIANRQVHHHVLTFLHLLRHHGSICVTGQAVGVHLAAWPVQHHGPGVGQTACAGQRLKKGHKKKTSYIYLKQKKYDHWWYEWFIQQAE